jgi:hypothetical protein
MRGLLVYDRRGLPAQVAALADCELQTDGYAPAASRVEDVSSASCSSGDIHTIV